MRELIDEVKRLGRPLTEKEAIRFEWSLLMNNEEKHCVMDDTEKPIEITEEIEGLIQKGMEIVQKDFPSLFGD